MKGRFAIDRRSDEVSIERVGSQLRVRRGKTDRMFQFERINEGIILRSDDQAWEVTFGSKKEDQIELFLDGEAFLFSWKDLRGSGLFERSGIGKGLREIHAVMPGRVARILVKAGERVEVDQPLLVLEAMKMENEIKSPRAGTIESIAVAEGSSVEANALLVRFEAKGNGHG